MENSIIKGAKMIDESMYTVIVLKYKIYRNDSGKIFGRLLVLKHRVENFLKEAFNEEILYQNPNLQRTKDGLVELIQGLTYLCSGITPCEVLTVPELSTQDNIETSFIMKFVKGTVSNMWLCYIDNDDFLQFLKCLRGKYEDNKLEQFVFYPRLGEHVYFKQGTNIFRGIVREYVIPDDSEEEEEVHVDIRVLNVDNSDIATLPINCFFKIDKDGIEYPMQCVLCTLEDMDKNVTMNSEISSSGFSLGVLKKHKLHVVFHHKKVCVNGLPQEAQCVTITVSADKFKDKKDGFNVNSKEFVPRGSISIETQIDASYVSSREDEQSEQTTRSSSPNSSQIINETSTKAVRIDKNSHETTPKIEESKTTLLEAQNSNKTFHKSVVNNINNYDKSPSRTPLPNQNFNKNDMFIDKNMKPNIDNKPPRPVFANIIDKLKYTSISPANESPPPFVTKKPNMVSISSPVPSYSHPPSQTQSPGLHQVPNAPPYMFQSVPQFPPAPIHFPGQYIPFSAATQPMNSAFPFSQYPYSTYLPTPPPVSHSQPYMPPSTTPYQPYMQPIAPIAMPYFTSQPPFSQQFYQAAPNHMQPTWSHLQASFGNGSSQNVASTLNVSVKTDGNTNNIGNKFK